MKSATHARQAERLAYRINEFCEAVGVSRSSFYNLVKAGKIKTIKLGAVQLVPAEEAARVLAEPAP